MTPAVRIRISRRANVSVVAGRMGPTYRARNVTGLVVPAAGVPVSGASVI